MSTIAKVRFGLLMTGVSLVLVGCAHIESETTVNTTPTATTPATTIDDGSVEETQVNVVNEEAEESTESVTEVVDDEVIEDESDEASAPVKPSSAAVKSFEMTATQYEFEPSTITVNEGDTVRVTITSEDTEHGFAIAEFDVSETVDKGETKTIEFVADAAGTYSFFCNVFCGVGHGSMKGTLVVQ